MRHAYLVLVIAFGACAGGDAPSTSSGANSSGTTLEANVNTTPPADFDPVEPGTTTSATGAEPSETTTGLQPRPTTSRAPEADLAGVPDWFSDQGALPSDLSNAIKAKLASDANVGVDQVVEEGAMFVTWRNSALGCQAPGEMSLQVLTDGYLAYFNVAGDRYRVHTDLDSAFRICNLAAPPDPLPHM